MNHTTINTKNNAEQADTKTKKAKNTQSHPLNHTNIKLHDAFLLLNEKLSLDDILTPEFIKLINYMTDKGNNFILSMDYIDKQKATIKSTEQEIEKLNTIKSLSPQILEASQWLECNLNENSNSIKQHPYYQQYKQSFDGTYTGQKIKFGELLSPIAICLNTPPKICSEILNRQFNVERFFMIYQIM